MSLALKDGETYITCPYDESHRILTHRFQTHLVKCRQNYQDMQVQPCCFNSTHIVPIVEYQYHVEHCKDKYLLDRHLFVPKDVDVDKYPIKNTQIPNSESWEDEEEVPTYDPKEHCLSQPILRRLDLASAANRRDFRNEERRRFQQFTDQPLSLLPVKKDQFLRLPQKPSETVPHKFEPKEETSADICNKFNNLNLAEGDRKPLPLSKILEKTKYSPPPTPEGVLNEDSGEWILAGSKSYRPRITRGRGGFTRGRGRSK